MPTAPSPSGAGGPHAALLHDRRLMALLIAIGVMALVVVSVVGFSGAYFTSTSRSPGNQFAAAGVGMELSQTGQVVDGGGMRPGDVRTGAQTVTNTGHRAVLVLDVLDLDLGSPLTGVLRVRVVQSEPAGTAPAYDGPLAGLDQVRLATLDRDERRTWTITVTWPEAEDSTVLEGASTSLDFAWHLEAVS